MTKRYFIGSLFMALMLTVLNVRADDLPVKSAVSGAISVAQAEKGKGIYAVYVGSDELTGVLRAGLAHGGFRVENDQSKAPLKLEVIPVYYGAASDRPKIGTAENGSFDISLGKLIGGILFGKAAGMGGALSGGGASSGVAAGYWGDVVGNSVRPSNLTYRSSPIDAMVVRLDFFGVGEKQTANVISESYAEGLPKAELVKESMRMVMWFME